MSSSVGLLPTAEHTLRLVSIQKYLNISIKLIFYPKDYWIDHYSSPKADDSQDWTLTHSQRNDSHIVFEFERPYKTCDALEDLEFNTNYTTQNIIWAFGHQLPESSLKIPKHTRKGVLEINWLEHTIQKNQDIETDIEVMDINFKNVSLVTF